jgi:hypothetical protein
MSEDYSEGTYSKLFEAAEKKQQPASPVPVAESRTQKVDDPPKQPTEKPSNRDTVIPRHHDTKTEGEVDAIEVVRKAVKPLGEKAATHRFTANEKDRVADIVYAQKKKGVITSENEITRIALNYLIWEHQQNKTSSILATVLERLNA